MILPLFADASNVADVSHQTRLRSCFASARHLDEKEKKYAHNTSNKHATEGTKRKAAEQNHQPHQ